MKVAIIGNPNVGKSAVINRLTGSNVLVSNYSGTSMEITTLQTRLLNNDVCIYDTPGVFSLESTDGASVATRELIDSREPDLIMNIVDAANLERNLVLTYELLERNIPLIVVINQIDRARAIGLHIDGHRLAGILQCPVVLFSAHSGEGLMELLTLLEKKYISNSKPAGEQVLMMVPDNMACSGQCRQCKVAGEESCTAFNLQRAEKARIAASMVTSRQGRVSRVWLDRMQSVLDRPYLGTLLLLFIAYLGFVVLLQFIHISEGPLYALLEPLNKWLESAISSLLPGGIASRVLSRAVPEGLTIPFTIIMPAMLMVSLLMSVLEDTGLLPRYSVALERAGRLFGVSGQAIIPLTLGFGCRTPAVLAARLMPTPAERFIVITLLSIVVPCAATLGVLAAVISAFHAYLGVVIAAMVAVLIVLGFVLSRMNPGEGEFIFELPPLRIPLWNNVWNKVKLRFSGFFTEVLPLLLVMNIIIRALMEAGFFDLFSSLEGASRWLFGIPAEALVAVLITIFQRYLAPLVLLNITMTPREATIAIAMIALSLPCLPVMVMTVREIGFKGLFKIIAMGLTTSFLVGILLHIILPF